MNNNIVDFFVLKFFDIKLDWGSIFFISVLVFSDCWAS